MNRTITLTTGFLSASFLAACGAHPGSAQEANTCSEGTCLGSTQDPLRRVGTDYPEAPEEPPPRTRPAVPPPLHVDLQLTGKAFTTDNGRYLYLEVTNVGTADLTQNLEFGTILMDGIQYHAEIPRPLGAERTGVVYVDLTFQVKSGECLTYTVNVDPYGVWQRAVVPGVINADPSTYANDTRVVHTQCPLGWDSIITLERLGFYGEATNTDRPGIPVDNLTTSDGFPGTDGTTLSPAIAWRALGTTLGTIVSSQVIVRDDGMRCSECHHREGVVGFYRPNIEKGSTQVISESETIGWYTWADNQSLPNFFVHALHPGTQDFEKSPALRWLMQRYRERDQWKLDLERDRQ